MSQFLSEVKEYNKKVNLVSRETDDPGLIDLAAGCLIPFEFTSAPTGNIFDIGSGGGFPSIVIMLAFPNLTGLLFERTEKKAVFLQSIIRKFSLRAEVRPGDFTQLSRQIPERSFDLGLMRYVKLDRKILAASLRILKNNGRFIHYSKFDNSLLKNDLPVVADSHSYHQSDSKMIRSFVVLRPKR